MLVDKLSSSYVGDGNALRRTPRKLWYSMRTKQNRVSSCRGPCLAACRLHRLRAEQQNNNIASGKVSVWSTSRHKHTLQYPVVVSWSRWHRVLPGASLLCLRNCYSGCKYKLFAGSKRTPPEATHHPTSWRLRSCGPRLHQALRGISSTLNTAQLDTGLAQTLLYAIPRSLNECSDFVIPRRPFPVTWKPDSVHIMTMTEDSEQQKRRNK